MSEIEDIFAAKGRLKATPSLPTPTQGSTDKKKSKRNDPMVFSKPAVEDAGSLTNSQSTKKSSTKRPAPETIVDLSVSLPSASKKQKRDPSSSKMDDAKIQKLKKSPKSQEDDGFTDSRGIGPRMYSFSSRVGDCLHCNQGKRTEEGWAVYREDELGITNEGGGESLTVA